MAEGYEYGRLVVVYHAEDPDCRTAIQGYRSLLTDPEKPRSEALSDASGGPLSRRVYRVRLPVPVDAHGAFCQSPTGGSRSAAKRAAASACMPGRTCW